MQVSGLQTGEALSTVSADADGLLLSHEADELIGNGLCLR